MNGASNLVAGLHVPEIQGLRREALPSMVLPTDSDVFSFLAGGQQSRANLTREPRGLVTSEVSEQAPLSMSAPVGGGSPTTYQRTETSCQAPFLPQWP